MWEASGEKAALADLESRIRAVEGEVETTFDWPVVRNLGLFTYVLSNREGRDPALLETVKQKLVRTAGSIVSSARRHGYARPAGSVYSCARP
ncbi:MAG: hypothetical protein ACREIA_13965 [Opitutaceae bacterium]